MGCSAGFNIKRQKCKMKIKVFISLIIFLIMVQLVQGICCGIRKDCVIVETCQDAACGNCTITIYNGSGTLQIPQSNMQLVTFYTYTYNASTSLNKYGVYPYAINCTNDKICQGVCQVDVKQECEEKEGMTTGIIIFLLTLNVGIFLAPVFLKHFSKNPVTDYIVKRMLFLAGMVFLWFNILILRVLAESFALGIDKLLEGIWIFFSLMMYIVIFASIYFMVIGAIQLSKQAVIKKRMGHEDGAKRF